MSKLLRTCNGVTITRITLFAAGFAIVAMLSSSAVFAGACKDEKIVDEPTIQAATKVTNSSNYTWQVKMQNGETTINAPLRSGDNIYDKNKNARSRDSYQVDIMRPGSSKPVITCTWVIDKVKGGSTPYGKITNTRWKDYICQGSSSKITVGCDRSFNAGKSRWNTRLEIVNK